MVLVFDVFLQERFKLAIQIASVDSSVYLKHALRLSAEDHIKTLTEQLIRVRDHEDGTISGKGADRSQASFWCYTFVLYS